MNIPRAALVVDDHPMVRQGIGFLLRDGFGFDDVRMAGTLEDGLSAASRAPAPVLAVLDLGLPGLSGVAGIEAFQGAFPQIAVVVISGTEDPATVSAVLAAGAKAFVGKSASPEETEAALAGVLNAIGSDAPPQSRALTPRQRDALACLARGLSTKEIARELQLAEGTVKIHLAGLFRSLGVRNRTEAAVRARALGISDIS